MDPIEGRLASQEEFRKSTKENFLLIESPKEYHNPVQRNHKLIYWLEDNYAKIATVLDYRHDPGTLNPK